MLGNGGGQPVRVFISYAHDNPEHEALVRELWCSCGPAESMPGWTWPRPRTGTLSLLACLAEMRPMIPPDQRASIMIAADEADALVQAGDLPSATQQLRTIRSQAEAQAAADPADTEGQRLLAVIHERLGGVAIAAGNLAAARGSHQASLDIRTRLAAADPANSVWQRDLGNIQQRISNLGD